MCRARLAGLSGFALACFGFSVFGQDHLVLPEQTLRLPAVRIADNEAPKLYGRLDDPVWQKAFAVDNFTQVHPNEGDEPTERTVLKVLYNERNVFFGIRCHDSEPDKINARHMMRDAAHMGDDSFLILLDGFRNNRNGYIFMLNPLGAMRDGLLNRTRRAHYDSSWDGIWDARCRIDDQGWVI